MVVCGLDGALMRLEVYGAGVCNSSERGGGSFLITLRFVVEGEP